MTSTAQNVTLTNTGNATLNIASIVASGDFAKTTTCAAALAKAASCNIDVTFTPTAVGALTGTVVISSDAASSPSTITLSGTGLAVPVTTTLDLAQGWNLLGNGTDQPLAVATVFGDAAKVTTVWKWDVATPGWQFYAPSMDAPTLQTYASGKGYGVLSSINAGEGFWVNAVQSHSAVQASGVAISGNDFATGKPYALKPGWNLIAIGNALTPAGFNLGLSATPPSVGTVPINLTTLWAWDNPLSKWYFYAPSLEGQGSTALTDYVTSKGYLDFTASGKLLGAGTGFWVNRP